MNYIEYIFNIKPLQPASEILIAQLGEVGFESFVETENGVEAYIQKSEWNENVLQNIQILSSSEFEISYTSSEIEQINWNEAWEKNFDPIEVDSRCAVRAPFHPKKNVQYEIIIEPKMSFGTGHHETTFMMLQFILDADFKEKTVLDMGCGTSVLAILASMRGAKTVEGIDNDDWCVENSIENIERNNCTNIDVYLGDANSINSKKYDVVIANINRNILLDDMEAYRQTMSKGGELYLSGFYKEDLPIIKDCCEKLDYKFVENKTKNNWVAAKFIL